MLAVNTSNRDQALYRSFVEEMDEGCALSEIDQASVESMLVPETALSKSISNSDDQNVAETGHRPLKRRRVDESEESTTESESPKTSVSNETYVETLLSLIKSLETESQWCQDMRQKDSQTAATAQAQLNRLDAVVRVQARRIHELERTVKSKSTALETAAGSAKEQEDILRRESARADTATSEAETWETAYRVTIKERPAIVSQMKAAQTQLKDIQTQLQEAKVRGAELESQSGYPQRRAELEAWYANTQQALVLERKGLERRDEELTRMKEKLKALGDEQNRRVLELNQYGRDLEMREKKLLSERQLVDAQLKALRAMSTAGQQRRMLDEEKLLLLDEKRAFDAEKRAFESHRRGSPSRSTTTTTNDTHECDFKSANETLAYQRTRAMNEMNEALAKNESLHAEIAQQQSYSQRMAARALQFEKEINQRARDATASVSQREELLKQNGVLKGEVKAQKTRLKHLQSNVVELQAMNDGLHEEVSGLKARVKELEP